MLARRTTVRHPIGVSVAMPRLVPSFSSKGFPFFRDSAARRTFSEVSNALELIGPFIKDAILVSAYDIHHKLLRRPERFYADKELVFIDSGGYELSSAWDTTEPKRGGHTPRPFTVDDYRRVLNRLPGGVPFVIASFDWDARGKPLARQIREAQELFAGFPNWMHNFLMKPSGKRKYVDVTDVMAHIGELQAFHVVGITEDELGRNLLDRLSNLAKIRCAMDREGIGRPIHVYGGLDPVMTPLYFFVGAEVFDGVSWLRYAYVQGTAVYRDVFNILGPGIETSLDHARSLALANNLTQLQRLATGLCKFADGGAADFGAFEWHGEVLERAYGVLRTRIPEIRRA